MGGGCIQFVGGFVTVILAMPALYTVLGSFGVSKLFVALPWVEVLLSRLQGLLPFMVLYRLH